MKVLFFNEKTSRYGGIDYILDLEIEGLRCKGFQVELFSVDNSDFLNSNIIRKGINIFQALYGEFKFGEFQSKLNNFKPDVVHFHNIYHLFGFPIWKKLNFGNAKVIQHLHNYYPFCLNASFFCNGKICTDCFDKNAYITSIKRNCYTKNKLKSLFLTKIRPLPKQFIQDSIKVDKFIAVSHFVKQKYSKMGLNSDKISVIYNGINNYFLEPAGFTKGKYILFIGNIQRNKGVFIFAEVASKLPKIKFLIVGVGNDLYELKQKYSVCNNIEFVGGIHGKEKEEYIVNCSFLFLPSLWWEPFMITIVEGFKYGKPVISFSNGGIPEVITHGYDGFLFDNTNIEKLVNNVSDLYYNIELLESLSKNCLASAKKFSFNHHIDALSDLYNQIYFKN